MEAPLKSFADSIQHSKNYFDKFKSAGNEFQEGDEVRGTWVDYAGGTHYQEGKIIKNDITGLWVESAGGITEIKRFWVMYHKQGK